MVEKIDQHQTKGDLEHIAFKCEVNEAVPEVLHLTSTPLEEGISLAALSFYVSRHGW